MPGTDTPFPLVAALVVAACGPAPLAALVAWLAGAGGWVILVVYFLSAFGLVAILLARLLLATPSEPQSAQAGASFRRPIGPPSA